MVDRFFMLPTNVKLQAKNATSYISRSKNSANYDWELDILKP